MSVATVFNIQLVVGYIPWLLFLGTYIWPRLIAMDRFEVQRAIATLHSFRFFGLIFIIPGIVGPNLPADFAAFAAYGDFATGILAILAEHLPNPVLLVFPDAGHGSLFQWHDSFVNQVSQFLASDSQLAHY
jgi:pimeloyl-ACP methyl ester carboxylesterase